MRRYGFCSRILALLLTLVMAFSALPIGAFAATAGQIVVNDNHGIVPSTLGQTGAVNWPVKIYDYLNDGMLFEPSNGRLLTGESDYLSASAMPYAGGRVMPTAKLGTNYALNTAYSETAYNWNLTQTKGTPNYKLERVSAVRFESPQYLHVSYPGPGSYVYMMLRGFATAQPKTAVRYMVLVYRANGRDADEEIDMRMVTSGGAYYGFLDEETYGLDITNSTEWQYLIVDFRDDVLGASRWEASGFNSVTEVHLQSYMNDAGDYIDLSSVAFFSTRQEADYYGQDALAFVNDPGEYLVDSQKLTFDAGQEVPEYYPAANEPGFNFSPNNTAGPTGVVATTNSAYYTRLGLNFALKTAQSTNTYSAIKNGTTLKMYTSATAYTNFTPTKMTITENNSTTNKSYITLSNTGTSSKFLLTNCSDSNNYGIYNLRAQYMVLVYRAHGYTSSDQFGFWSAGYTGAGTGWGVSGSSGYTYKGYNTSNWTTDSSVLKSTITPSPNDGDIWVADVINISSISTTTYMKFFGMYLPTGSGKSLDIAYVGYFSDSTSATDFSNKAAAYMNAGKLKGTTTSGGTTKTIKANRGWNMGNNLAWGLLSASDGASKWTQLAGGNNTNVNGYYSYAIGKCLTSAYSYINDYRVDFNGNAYTDATENKIYLVRAQSMTLTDGYYDMSGLEYDGYNLLQKMSQGFTTSGMLEGTLVNGKPVYRQETVEYVANLLYNTLVIPSFDADGDYNYNFVKGEKSSQFKMDINGDGDYDDSFDLNGDTYAETKEASMDLATALRLCLGIEFSFGTDKGTSPTKGTYAATLSKVENGKLMGTFADCKGDIATCVDAAYFLLNNLFVDNSYNQLQTDYNYLSLSSATLTDGREAFVFDAGFTTGTGNVFADGYADKSQSAIVYNPVVTVNPDGSITYGDGTISLSGVNSKDEVTTGDDTDNSPETTRFPFLPVTNTKGDYPKDTESYYWRDDSVLDNTGIGGSYEGRNFGYVMASNGEFVYREDDQLFFEFEGDDDVYLFINGQLVLDIGGAHAIAKAKIDVNSYVQWAKTVIASYEAGQSTYSETEYKRAKSLNLVDGEVYSFDFYYMERHGYGANCRIVTNMQVTDPSLQVEKDATQFGDHVPYGSVVDTGSPIGYSFTLNNTGNTKLYNLTFVDAAIGVSLDPVNGLTVAKNTNVFNEKGGELTAKDLWAVVDGVDAFGNPSRVEVTFANNEALRVFLESLKGEGLADEEYVGATNAGSGLWVNSTVTIGGIYYRMSEAQVAAGVFTNTVEVSATTKQNASSAGCETLRSSASHRVYKATAPIYYQWAGHNLFVSGAKLLQDAAAEAARGENSPLYQYKTFLDTVGTDTSQVYFRISDKTSYVATYDGITSMEDETGWGLVINHGTPGAYTFYLTIFYKAHQGKLISDMPANSYAFMQITVYVSDVQDSAYVLDYGLQTETLDVDGELFGLGTSKSVLGVSTQEPSYLDAKTQTDANFNRISFAAEAGATAVNAEQGTFNLSYDEGKISDLSFTPTSFMDGTSELYVALAAHAAGATPSALGSININQEAQMFKKVTVLPASVVYYEDDFSGIVYTADSSNVFTDYSEGSGLLTQSTSQTQPYGQDKTYQSSTNVEYSGNHMTRVQIKDTSDAAKFTFTGTGFELIGRTNATDSGIIVIRVFDAQEYEAYETGNSATAPTALQTFPVITKFDNGNNGGAEGIYQVPTVRVNGLDRKAYTVVISGNPSYDFSKWDKTAAGLAACIIPTYLYIDGLRIYEPMDTNNSYYADAEKGAAFLEVRDLIVNGKVAVAELKNQQLALSTGSTTWTEQLGPVVPGDDTTTYVGTKVDNSSDYLIQGPNNEVYMDGSVTNSAMAFYVKETGDGSHSLQIAARAMNYAMFYGAGKSELSVKLQYSVVSGDGYAWMDLVTVTSGTEQYYSVPYFDCPKDDSGNYRVLIRAVSTDHDIPAMVSYSMIKAVGLEILEVEGHGDATDLYFKDGILVTPEYSYVATASVEEQTDLVTMNMVQIKEQMSAGMPVADADAVQPELTLHSASLSLEDEVKYNIYFSGTNLDNVVQMGLVMFDSKLSNGTVHDAVDVISGYTGQDGNFIAQTRGVAARNLGDMIYFRVYAQLSDGTYAYSKTGSYNVVKYANHVLAGDYPVEMKQLAVALLNYGTAAQNYFDYNTDAPINAQLTAEQAGMVEAYRADMIPATTPIPAEKRGAFTSNGGFSDKWPTISLESAFSINYYFTPSEEVVGDVIFYYWTQEDCQAVEVLTADNATGVATMAVKNGVYSAAVTGIPAKWLDDTVYTAAVYTAVDGTVYCSGVLRYSLGAYCANQAEEATGVDKALAEATAVYGYYANAFFA